MSVSNRCWIPTTTATAELVKSRSVHAWIPAPRSGAHRDGWNWLGPAGGQPKQRTGPRDVIWTPRGVEHWHGATATGGMTHIAIQGAVDGRNVGWMEKVSDERCLK
jgi:hypothetical protein